MTKGDYERPDRADDGQPALEPAEQAALDAVLSAPELTDAEWDRLRHSTLHAAERLLAQRRVVLPDRRPAPSRVRPPRRPSLRWIAPALPVAAAAVLLLVLVPRNEPVAPFDAAVETLLADVSDDEFRLLVAGHADAASLLLLAVQDEADDR
jgi:ferric-dicitrate binding protein FerR (iron transport regulator)